MIMNTIEVFSKQLGKSDLKFEGCWLEIPRSIFIKQQNLEQS